MGIRQMKQQHRRDQLKIRRLQAQGGTKTVDSFARSASSREIRLQNELREMELANAANHAIIKRAVKDMTAISHTTRAKEAREIAGAFLGSVN